tara:strand:- start:4 stop:441 length:438 start_codon:yes stop_codon:yes gene_type:complete
MSPFIQNNGYQHVAPKFGASRKKLLVHRLIAKAFVAGWFDGATVNHKDGDKLNNLPQNLEWMTLAENTSHQWETGLVNIRGQRHPSAKLTDAQSLEIAARNAESPTLLAREYGVSVSMIYKIRQGRKKAWLSAPPTASHAQGFHD